jgi:hypothetical protein
MDKGSIQRKNVLPYVEFGVTPVVNEEINGPDVLQPKRIVYEKGPRKRKLIRPATKANHSQPGQRLKRIKRHHWLAVYHRCVCFLLQIIHTSRIKE